MSDIAASHFYPNIAVGPAAVAAKLGDGTSQLYTWVRSKLGIPTHCGLDDDPLYSVSRGLEVEGKKSIGSWVSMVYESLKGPMVDMVMEGLDQSRQGPRTKEDFEKLCDELRTNY